MNSTDIKCALCKTNIHPLEVFPGNYCLECHAARTECLTPDELFKCINETFNSK